MERVKQIPVLVRELYSIVRRLERLFPERRFTLDGHLVGSIGEVLAANAYGLELLPASAEGHDARATNGTLVQIKATQVKSIALRSEPEHLLVLRILPDGRAEEVYNGPGALAWSNAGKMQKNGQRPIAISKLTKLMEGVPKDKQLAAVEK
jgi:hypothetical protein